MSVSSLQHVYGPVPSRRLGRSLGVDLVPFKVCTYDCLYCQLGPTTDKTVVRKEYVDVEGVLTELEKRLELGPLPDTISLAGSGEPTLNRRIEDVIKGIKKLSPLPVAVLTNGSLLSDGEVREALMDADLVLPSLDAGDEGLFRQVNRPHGDVSFPRMVEGLAEFCRSFRGEVWLETLLLQGLTGTAPEVKKIAAIARHVRPARVQLSTVCRPTAYEEAAAVSPEAMEEFKQLLEGQAERIHERAPGESASPAPQEVTDADLLALLRRRPCTVGGIAAGLGLHPTQTVKRLLALSRRGLVASERRGNSHYYEAVRDQ